MREHYMVKKKSEPYKEHFHLQDAKDEAIRLAECNPGEEFIIFKSLGFTRTVKAEYITLQNT